MNVREWLNHNQSGAIVITVLAVAVAVVVVWQTLRTDQVQVMDAYHYDVDAGVVFVGPADSLPPIETPAGGDKGVRAAIFACNNCPQDLTDRTIEEIEQTGAFIGYFERYSDEAKEILERDRASETADIDDPEFIQRLQDAEVTGRLVRRPQEDGWTVAETEHGMSITDEYPAERCGEAVPRTCMPQMSPRSTSSAPSTR